MMSIVINGRIKQKKEVLDFAYNIMFYLMPRLKRNVYIDINVVTKCDGENSALCYGDRESVEIELARESFDHKFLLEEMMVNLAHELVHAKQFIRGDLHPRLYKWKKQDCKNMSYGKRPWEKEAYLLENELYNKFWN